jgi:ATP-binding protein involved in chromosome partitioning
LRFMSLGLFLTDDQPVIWRGPLASRMVQQFLTDVVWGELDYLLIDLPPGSGDVQITLAQQAFLTGAIIVTTPQQLSLGVAKKGLQMFAHVNVPILGIVENMSGFTCPHCGEHTAIFKTGGGAQMASTLGVNFLGGIPIDPDLMASADDGVPLLERNTTSPAAVAFAELAGKLAGVLSQKEFADFDLPKTIDVSNNGGLVLEWADGEKSEFSPHDLRVNCPCAGCVDEQTGQRTLNPKSVPLDIRIKDFQRVGRYAVACAFSDGHNTGIYSYSRLRELAHRHQETERKTFDV